MYTGGGGCYSLYRFPTVGILSYTVNYTRCVMKMDIKYELIAKTKKHQVEKFHIHAKLIRRSIEVFDGLARKYGQIYKI